MVIELAPDFSPLHAANIRTLVHQHYFDGLAIVRVQDNFVTQWGSKGADAGQFKGPYGIKLDGSGNVWVADAFNARIQRFNANGGYVGSVGVGQLNTPIWLSFDAAGNYYVTDTNRDPQDGAHASIQNQRVLKYSTTGTLLTSWGTVGEAGGQFRLPFCIVVDAAGNGYVSDYYNTRIQKFNLNAALTPAAPQINSVS